MLLDAMLSAYFEYKTNWLSLCNYCLDFPDVVPSPPEILGANHSALFSNSPPNNHPAQSSATYSVSPSTQPSALYAP
eukprot:12902460-Ditylum_brightwellii.AAC.1